jgi:hypothetical protein
MGQNIAMKPLQRLETVFSGRKADRTPSLGGWIAGAESISQLAGKTVDDFWQDPVSTCVLAYKFLGADGLIDFLLPASRHDYRCVDENSYARANLSEKLEDAVARVEAMTEAEEIKETFNLDAQYARFKDKLLSTQAKCGDIVYMPAIWGAGAYMSWYFQFGYENFFLMVGLYPEHARKLIEIGGADGYNKCRLVARAVKEGLYPHALLLGEDICSQRGPMVSVDFIEKYYAPQLREGLKPLLDVGCRPVWHSDGDIRPLIDMLIDCGIQGFQGFQSECGVKVEDMIRRRTRDHGKLLIFGPMSVTVELPVMNPRQVQAKVRYYIDLCRSDADLVFFTSNSINPDVSVANIIALYQAVQEYSAT